MTIYDFRGLNESVTHEELVARFYEHQKQRLRRMEDDLRRICSDPVRRSALMKHLVSDSPLRTFTP